MVDENRDAFVSALVLFESSSCSCSRSTSSRGSVFQGTFNIAIELDSVANNERTSFYANEIVYVRVTTDAPRYECKTTGDEIYKVATNVPEIIVEDIVFANTAEGALSNLPAGAVDYQWIGRRPVGINPVFDGGNINLREKTIGLLRCTYSVLGDRWAIKNYLPGEVAVIAYVPDYPDSAYLTIQFEEDPSISDEAYDAFELKVIDYCTEEPVEGVSITFDGIVIGSTDEDGLIFLGPLSPDTYPLIMTKAGFLASNIDKLHNDSIIITSQSTATTTTT